MGEENKSVSVMWDNYLAKIKETVEDTKKTYEAWSFCFGGEVGDELAILVLEGKKKATASLHCLYELEEDELPKEGDLNIILDGNGTAKCVIETKVVQLVPFNQVTERFAVAEGEGDLSLEYWKTEHKKYFVEELKEYGKSFDENMLVVCEEFEVVYADTVIDIVASEFLEMDEVNKVRSLENITINRDKIAL